LRPYYHNDNVLLITPTEKFKTMKINGRKYHNGLAMRMKMQISGRRFRRGDVQPQQKDMTS